MAESPLLKPFISKLQGSKIYRALSTEKQATLVSTYQEATDEQLKKAMAVLDQREAELEKMQAEESDRQAELAQTAGEIKIKSAELEKMIIREESAKEKEDSAKQADDVLSQLNAIDEKGKPKRKKFLGLF